MVAQAVKARVSRVARAKALPAHRAMALRRRAAMARQVRVLKARAMDAAKAVAKAAVAVKNNGATRVLTTVVMGKVVQLPATTARAPKDVAKIRHAEVRAAVKTAATVMATSCHATLIP